MILGQPKSRKRRSAIREGTAAGADVTPDFTGADFTAADFAGADFLGDAGFAFTLDGAGGNATSGTVGSAGATVDVDVALGNPTCTDGAMASAKAIAANIAGG